MGLWYFLTLYCAIRGMVSSTRPTRWYGLAILCSVLGMSSKPVMVTAPLVVLFYDRVFVAGSWRSALRQRAWFYGALAATWIVLGVWLLMAPEDYSTSAGFAVRSVSWWQYGLTQPGVVLRYLKLVVWPQPLILDYGWPVATTVGAIVWPALALIGVGAATRWISHRQPAIGFLGVVFFLTLAPSSSVIPLEDLAFEHRLYLPLAALVTLGVMCGEAALRRLLRPPLRGVPGWGWRRFSWLSWDD